MLGHWRGTSELSHLYTPVGYPHKYEIFGGQIIYPSPMSCCPPRGDVGGVRGVQGIPKSIKLIPYVWLSLKALFNQFTSICTHMGINSACS